jgi:hypothetical protein
MRDFLKKYIIEAVVILLFLLFLFSIPKLFTDESKIEYTLTSPIIGENQTMGKILEITKFQVISDAVIQDFVNTTIEDSNSQVAIDLILENKITNKQNSVGQELISLYERKELKEVEDLSYDIIENRLEKYDKPQDRKWRNEALYIFHGNETYLVYENINLLVKVPDSDIVGLSKAVIRPYAYQKYIFTYKNGTKEIITIDLKTKEADKDISEFIDIETGKPKIELEDLKIEFIESEEEYLMQFVIWK